MNCPDSRIEVVLTPAKPSGVLELEIFLQVSPQSKSYLQINVKFKYQSVQKYFVNFLL